VTIQIVGEPVRLEPEVAFAVRDLQLAEHGGLQGLRDPDALQAALQHHQLKWACREADPGNLAGAYAWGLANRHPFADGDRRAAWVLATASPPRLLTAAPPVCYSPAP
jgi:death-on-curing protein